MKIKFKINYTNWTIQTKPMQELLDAYNKAYDTKADFCSGLTFRSIHEIWLAEELCEEQTILVLKHELAHCWIWMYGHYFNDNVNEDDICEVIAKSNSFINEVVEKFKRGL